MTKAYCEKQQKKLQLDIMKGSLGRVLKCVESAGKYFEDKSVAMKQCQDSGLSSISDLRQRINTHLDQKQEEITQELISKYKAEKTNVDVSRHKMSRLRAAVQNTMAASMAAVQIYDHVEMIQLFNRGETEIRACNDLIDEISSSKSVNIKHDIHVTIDPSSPLSLGRILVEEQQRILPDGVEYIQNNLPFNSRVRNFKKFNINVPSDERYCNAYGVVLMSNRDMVISDSANRCLKLFSLQGECLNVLNINGYPHDVCLVNDSTVAVAVDYNEIGIHVVNVNNSLMTLSTVVRMPERCCGLTYLDGTFMVSTPKSIYRVGITHEAKKLYQLPKASTHLVADSRGKCIFASMFTSKQNGVVVTRLSSGKQKGCVLRVGLVKGGRGIDVDREGNLYVCGHESNNVVQMSADGKRMRELLTSKDGINCPEAIYVHGNKFVVTNKGQNDLQLYQLI